MRTDGNALTGPELVVEIERRLFEAGCTLAAMPACGLRPAEIRANWPEIVRSEADLLFADMDAEAAPSRPSAAAISRMGEALDWVAWIEHRNHRLVILLRMAIHPISHRHRMSWRQIADRLGTNHHTAKGWASCGIAVIAKKIAQPDFFASQTSQNAVFLAP
ncbi:DUF6362 family protein [Gluconacetobacter sp. Hr-1-5]|uniref:DUF6362 family protein n=1 Tax=Gluconacetobacter sp. Hr-1-5 TaxID=3395370 RepID=UPI003B52CB77